MTQDVPTTSGERQNHKPGYFIEALAHGLRVLDAFSSRHTELTLGEIAEVAGVSTPSALRIGYTLVQVGYLVRNPVTKGYRLGPKIVSVGIQTLNSLMLPELARPYLIDLRDRTQETIKLAVHAGPVVVFVARVPSLLYPPRSQYVGTTLPIHASSLGRTILAYLPPETAKDLIARSTDRQLTPNTLTPTQAMQRLPLIRERGYELNDRGATFENRAAAAPLLDAAGDVVGAINLSVSAQRMSMEELERQMSSLVVETASVISSILPPDIRAAGWTASPLHERA